MRAPRRGAWLLALALGLGGLAGSAVAAPPGLDPDALPPPPGPGEGGGEGDDGGGLPGPPGEEGGDETGGQTEEELLALQREEEFQEHLTKAHKAERERRWSEAVREYKAALRIHDNDPEVLRGLGHARRNTVKDGRCPRRAIENLLLLEVYDPKGLWVTERGHAVDWMGMCGASYAAERLVLAEELAALEPGTTGRPDHIQVIAASLLWDEASRRVDQGPEHGQRSLEYVQGYLRECEEDGKEPVADALYLLGEIQRINERLEPAIGAYRRFVELYPADPRRKQADAWIDELEIQATVLKLQEAQGGRPSAVAEAAYRRGLAALRAGKLAEAQSELEAAVEDSPWFPRAHYHLGRVHARRRKFPEAVDALKKAAAMEPQNYAAHVALGMLYFKEYKGVEDQRAREHLEKALRLRPDLYDLHFYLGELYTREDREKAREHYESFIEACPPGDLQAKVAREALRSLERETVANEPIIVPPPPAELRRLDPELQRLINEAYVVGTEHGDWNRAEKLLLKARDQFPDEPALLNELAKVVVAQGRPGDARTYWEDSLALEDDQLEVHERLGLLIDAPEEAERHLRRAAELGSTTARFELARRLWDRYSMLEASEQLDLYLQEAGPYDISWERAQNLRVQMDRVFLRIYLVGGITITFLLMWPIVRLYRRLRGYSLSQLLDRAPKSYPEVARILSLIRHEILKHNTAFLSDVGHALQVDAPDADARASLLARRLFGAAGEVDVSDEASLERRGIYGRFLGYCRDLEAVGRSHEVNLNLARKDPTFRSMLRAFEDLARRAKWLQRTSSLRSGQRLELARVLERSGHVLGRKAFEQLSGIIQSLCVVEVTHELVQGVFDRVCQEDQFSGLDIAPLEVTGAGGRIRIFQTDLEDIMVNVLRNSLSSSALYASRPLDLVMEVDEITGLSSLAIRVKDRSPERLTNEMLRGRYVERGMGITADLLSRYDGAIAVEPEPDWEKAVVLRFFSVEDGDGGEV